MAGGDGVDGVAAGWYDDRATAGVVRWFDGSAWTEHTRPVPAEPTFVASSGAPSPTGQPTFHGGAYSPVPTHAPAQTASFGGGPAAHAPGLTSFGHEQSHFGQPWGAGTATFGGTSYPGALVNQVAIDSMRRRVLRDFWFGVGFLLFGAAVAFWVTATISSSGGYGGGRHYVSTAGVISGLVSFYRARRNYKAMLAMGGEPWTSTGLTGAVVGGSLAVLLSAAAIVNAYTATGSPEIGPAEAGSCWAGGNGTVWQVSCGAPHSYQATAVIADGGSCPSVSDNVVSLSDGSGNALCLAPVADQTASG